MKLIAIDGTTMTDATRELLDAILDAHPDGAAIRADAGAGRLALRVVWDQREANLSVGGTRADGGKVLLAAVDTATGSAWTAVPIRYTLETDPRSAGRLN